MSRKPSRSLPRHRVPADAGAFVGSAHELSRRPTTPSSLAGLRVLSRCARHNFRFLGRPGAVAPPCPTCATEVAMAERAAAQRAKRRGRRSDEPAPAPEADPN
jgi:hypothetical protein